MQDDTLTPAEQLHGKLIHTASEFAELVLRPITPELKAQAHRLLAFASELVAAV